MAVCDLKSKTIHTGLL